MTHVVVTRMLYQDSEPFLKRLELYYKLFNSLKNQTVQNFDIAVLCNRKHADILKEIFRDSVIPFFTKEDNFGQRDKTWHCKIPWEEIEGLNMYDIQSNIDSDDWVSENYIETIQKHCKDKSLHIHFQPTLVRLKTGQTKSMNSVYNKYNGSAFYSLYQPDKSNYIYIGQDGHRRMQNYAEESILIPEGYAFVGIHDNNDSTTWNA